MILSNLIQAIRPHNYSPKINNHSAVCCSRGICCDTFEKQNSDIIKDCKNFKIPQYFRLDKKQKKQLYKEFSKTGAKSHLREILPPSLGLKRYFDEKYGKDGYVFVSIGTSPSTVGRVFEFCGVETKYLPISELSIVKNDFNFNYSENYAQFLKEQKLTKEDIENSDKVYIFIDSTKSGRSIKACKSMISNCYDIPICNKTKFYSLNDTFIHIAENYDDSYFDYCDMLLGELTYGNPANYGGIPHLPFYQMDKIDELKSEKASEKSKQFNFLLMNELENRKLLKYNPDNEMSL